MAIYSAFNVIGSKLITTELLVFDVKLIFGVHIEIQEWCFKRCWQQFRARKLYYNLKKNLEEPPQTLAEELWPRVRLYLLITVPALLFLQITHCKRLTLKMIIENIDDFASIFDGLMSLLDSQTRVPKMTFLCSAGLQPLNDDLTSIVTSWQKEVASKFTGYEAVSKQSESSKVWPRNKCQISRLKVVFIRFIAEPGVRPEVSYPIKNVL